MTKVNRLIFIGAILADQTAKFLAQFYFPKSITKNPGLPFGVDLPGFFDLVLVMAALAGFVILYRIYFPVPTLGFWLIVSGALSNFSDRVAFGYVRDIVDAGIATVNLADILIWTGVVLLLINQKVKIN